jgi:hypothetical protein
LANLSTAPDAGNPPVRFDERDVETESWLTTKARPDERGGNGYAQPTATAPHIDPTEAIEELPVTWAREVACKLRAFIDGQLSADHTHWRVKIVRALAYGKIVKLFLSILA